jgi:hypothetical protein
MGKRGRPKTNGAMPGWMFVRVVLVLHAYNEARSSGCKHSSAVTEAVATVKKTWSGMPISETGVKRILAKHQPKGDPVAFQVTKISEETPPPATTEIMGVPHETRLKPLFSFGFGPRPKYPRI